MLAVTMKISASNVIIANLTVQNLRELEQTGILISNAQNVYLSNLVIEYNYRGLIFHNVNNSRVFNCTLRENEYAVTLRAYSQNNTFVGNNIMKNQIGVWIEQSCNANWFYHNNFVNNNQQVDPVNRGTNTKWNNTYPIGGNYWSDYLGVDNNGDGIGDTPHTTGGATDYLPLMKPSKLLPPIAKFSISPPKPKIYDEVTFNATESYDLDGNIVGYIWNFGDGNTTITGNPIIKHNYSKCGKFNVTLTVTDNHGLKDSTTIQIQIDKLKSTITISAIPKTIYWGQEITIMGRLTPEKENQSIIIRYMRVDNSLQFTTWRNLTTVKTNSTGYYVHSWKPEKPAMYILAASWPGDDTTYGSSNKTDLITVEKLKSIITIKVEPEKLTLGQNITVKGNVTPLQENAVCVNITISNGSNTWNLTTQTDVFGDYTCIWTPPNIGNYTVKASWQGNEYVMPAESETKTFKVEQSSKPEGYTPYYTILVILVLTVLAIVIAFKFKRK